MQKAIEQAVTLFKEKIKNRDVKIISHHDTDGISSAAIMAKTLMRLEKKFAIKIVKNLEKEFIKTLHKEELLIFLDLGSSLLEEIGKLKCDVFIIDHHEITGKQQENTTFINPHLFNEEAISASGLTYLFAKKINPENKDLANLAIIGMVGDMLGREISKLNKEDSEVLIKKGLIMYPATRPIHKILEFSSSIFIPGVTGNPKGVLALLREAGIKKENGNYKSLIELNEQELSKLITAIILRTKKDSGEIIGNIYLVKFFNRLEDARELSAMINACSRLGYSNVALALCLKNKKSRKRAEHIYANYKQHLVAALNFANNNKIEKKGYVLINAKNKIKDTIIGTVASIISMSRQYKEGTIIIAMSYDKEKIKVSARISGRNGRNVREILEKTVQDFGGECGGHALAAGCLIPRDKEKQFIENLSKNMELEVVKI